jgi:hypothetical protein
MSGTEQRRADARSAMMLFSFVSLRFERMARAVPGRLDERLIDAAAHIS